MKCKTVQLNHPEAQRLHSAECAALDQCLSFLGWRNVRAVYFSQTCCLPQDIASGGWGGPVHFFPVSELESVAASVGPDDVIWFDPFTYAAFRTVHSATIVAGRCRARLVADFTALGVLPFALPEWLSAVALSTTSERHGDWTSVTLRRRIEESVQPRSNADRDSEQSALLVARGQVAANVARWMRRSRAVKEVLYPSFSGDDVTLWGQLAARLPQPVRLSLVLADECALPEPSVFAANRALQLRPPGRGQWSSVELISGGSQGGSPLVHIQIGPENEDDIWEDIDRVFYDLEVQCRAGKSNSWRDTYVN